MHHTFRVSRQALHGCSVCVYQLIVHPHMLGTLLCGMNSM
jgi:hypothetical protein